MDYKKELAFAKELALEAGGIMRRYFREENIGTEWKEDNTPLTVADTTINSLVIERVKAVFPEYGVLGEEESFEPERPWIWVVDPIDGTVPFSLGIPLSTFSLALVDRTDGQAVACAVYDPVLDHLFTSTRGGGAFLNDKKLSTSISTDLQRAYLAVNASRPKGENGYLVQGRFIEMVREQGARYLSFQAHVYCSTLVASGRSVGAVFGYGSPWDSAAVSLLVEEAGGVVTDLEGSKRRYDEFADGCILAANQQILEKLLKAVKSSRP